MSRILVTTADERTWPEDQPILFLGEWCRLYNRKAKWKDLDAEVVPYHWDDREKLHRDYCYLQDLYEELLEDLSAQLNALHGVSHSLRYWRILVGPWLGFFVQMLFDRWAMISRAVIGNAIVGIRVLDFYPEQPIPNDMEHFGRLFIEDAWNEAIYSQLIQGWTSVPAEKLGCREQFGARATTPPVLSKMRRLKRTLARIASIISQLLVRNDEVFFISSYLPLIQDLRVQWCLGQFPKIWKSLQPPKVQVDWDKRDWSMRRSGDEGFSAIVRSMIPQHIPTLYLEGYRHLQARCLELRWPNKPSLIFTSNAFLSDDVFKAWAAERVEIGTPLVIGQHGGSYGVALLGFSEDHECAIGDAFLSWGWEGGGNPRIKSVGNLKMVNREWVCDPHGGALMIEMTLPRYSYHLYSVPVASQWLDYFEEQCRFVSALPENLRGQLLVRLFSQDHDYCQKERWQDRFPEIRLDDGVVPIASLVKKSRLSISTYNATTFLESLAMNVPTIMFWNPRHWELRASAVPLFESLKTVGIFHETPESAAQQMTQVWDDVAGWWESEIVQVARQQFCHCYSRVTARPIEELAEVLRQVARPEVSH